MLQTLFVIPHWLLEGWLTAAWMVVAAGMIAWRARSRGWAQAAGELLPTFSVMAVAIHFLLPRLSVPGVDPADPTGPLVPLGLAVRGYGLMLMLAILSAIGLVQVNSRRAGLDPDRMTGLCFWMVIAGLAGARIFYVVQKWGTFGEATLVDLIDMTQGGLVVYGSLFGGLLAVLVYCGVLRMRLWSTLDVLAPAMLLGLAIGRIGCLMNGCCYGGECGSEFPLGIGFPAGSAPYMEQMDNGRLFGIESEVPVAADGVRVVHRVEAGSLAGEMGLVEGERFVVQGPDPLRLAAAVQWQVDEPALAVQVTGFGSGTHPVPPGRLPPRARPIHPTQIYAAVNAGLLCLVLWFLGDHRRFEGEIFATLIVAYPVARFLEEMIRQDETGIFGTPLTISQWISVFLLGFGVVCYGWLFGRDRKARRMGQERAAGV